MQIKIDKELCVGCGLCENTCPEVFKVTNNISEVQEDALTGTVEQNQLIQQASDECPVMAIEVTE